MTAIATFAGALVGLGLTLIIAGVRGSDRPRRLRLDLHARVDRAGVRYVVAVVSGLLVGVLTRWPVGVMLGAGAGFVLPGLIRDGSERTAQIARIEAIAGWAEMLRDTMAGAAGLEQAIEATAGIAPAAIRDEVAQLATRMREDRSVVALRAFADDVADPTCDLVVASLLLASEHQVHRLGDLLSSLATAARDQASMRLRVDASRARTRTSVRVIVAVTIVFALGLVILNRTYLSPYDGALGQMMLLVVGVLFTTAFAWLSRMARPVRPQRLLRSEASA